MSNRPEKDAAGNDLTDKEKEDAARFVSSKKVQEAIDKAVKEIEDRKKKEGK